MEPEAQLERQTDGGIAYVLTIPCPNACYEAGAVAAAASTSPGVAVLDVVVAYRRGEICAQVLTTVSFAGTIPDAAGVTAVLFRITDQRNGRVRELSAAL